MGSKFSRSIRTWSKRKQRRLLILGLDNAGKTTILHQMNLGKPVSTVPTMGFNVEKVKHNKLTLFLFDVGGQDKLRFYWRHYFMGTQGIIFVVDSVDRERFPIARNELKTVLRDKQLNGVPVVIFANKQDVPHAATMNELARQLDLREVCGARRWKVVSSNALTGDGLVTGFDFLCDTSKQI
eukprot:TRINITY_DN773044_c0_g1_i1.p1 TRINITY_DN773044_c0_g1~~TRINITY_DN773044_c0_g1_i1.p1  ORF type:complete len:182 (-),score=39.08 TRINITY_DN773044_c0_g1_i1:250-795(-)